jgi:hypothetical protein
MSHIEQSYGVAPTSGQATPNTSLILESVNPSNATIQANRQPPAIATPAVSGTGARGIGGYTLTPGQGFTMSPFENLLFGMANHILSPLQPSAASGGNQHAVVTPAEPPRKRANFIRFKFLRNDGNDTYSTEISTSSSDQTLKDLKHLVCSSVKTDQVFKFDPSVIADLVSKKKLLSVNIGGEWEQEYDMVKMYTVDELLQGLSPTASHANPITLEFKLVDITSLCGDIEMETYDSDAEMS